MFRPDDPLAPRGPAFDEPWQAEALAIADSLVRGGAVSASAWAEALGTALKHAEAAGAPDTLTIYYGAVLAALEDVTARADLVSASDRAHRRAAWEAAYRRTPHGRPVTLDA